MAEKLVAQLIDILKIWAKKQNTKQFINFYLFGSLLNGNGNQFLPDISDIDLIVICQNSRLSNRVKVCQKLQGAKQELEKNLLRILQRKNKSKSVVSLVLVTDNEVIWDIHKSKTPRFFRDNKFLNLMEEGDTLSPVGLDNREALSDIVQAIEQAQDYRNKYLSSSPNKSKEYNGKDIFPKELARSAAQVCSFDEKNEIDKFDINMGNSYLLKLLHQKARKKNNEWYHLHSKVIQRWGRSIKRPTLNDFDLLLLHELLFDKASALLKRNSSNNQSKGGHQPRGKGNSPATPAANKQSNKIPDITTKSKSLAVADDRNKIASVTTTKPATASSTVARDRQKTASATTTKPATANKKSTTPRKTRVPKTGTTRSNWTVKDPKDWVMLDESFFLSESIITQHDRSIVLKLSTMDRDRVAELKSLHPGEFHNTKLIAYADQSEAAIMQVSSVLSELSAGKTRFNITLTPTQRSQNNGFAMYGNYSNYGAGKNNYSADKIAELCVRRILLGEPLPKDLEPLFYATQVEQGIFPELWVKLQTKPDLFLPKAWLKAVYYLKINRIVEDVLELELGPIKNKVMSVRFRGKRQAYANQEPSIIEFKGSCTLGE